MSRGATGVPVSGRVGIFPAAAAILQLNIAFARFARVAPSSCCSDLLWRDVWHATAVTHEAREEAVDERLERR